MQNNRRQVGAQNLRVGKLRTRQEVVFRIKTNTDPFGDAAAAALTLVSRRLGNRLNRQALYFSPEAVAADTRGAWIDNVLDARHGQRSFRDVGGQHDPPPAVGLEHAILFAVGQSRIQRQYFGMAQIQLIERIGGIANFALAAHKNEDIAGAFTPELINGVENRLQLIALGVVGVFNYGSIAHFYRVGAPGHFDNRRVVKVAREAFRIDGRRGDNNFQIRATGQQFPQITQQEVDIEAAFVRFIDDDGVILHQQPVLLDFRQQNTVGHQLNHGVIADVVAKANFIADAAARLRLQLFGDAVGDGTRGQATRLRMAN